MKKENKKCGIVITYHNNVNKFAMPCLDSVLKNTPEPRYIIVFDNESTKKNAIMLPKKYTNRRDIEFIRINDQLKNGGLTGTWNQGIDKCFKNGCEKVILLNDDTEVDESWATFIQKIKDSRAVYGPISNSPGNNHLNKQENTKEFSLKNKNLVNESELINGFCMGFTKEALIFNKFDKKHYFNPKFPFGYNEAEWQKRFREKGGRAKIVGGCFVFHYKKGAWVAIDPVEKSRRRPDMAVRKMRNVAHSNLLKSMGKLGIFLKRKFPVIYFKLKPYFPDG